MTSFSFAMDAIVHLRQLEKVDIDIDIVVDIV